MKNALMLLALATALIAPRQSAATVWPGTTAGSVPVCTSSGVQLYPAAVTDNAGGVYVAWLDQRSGAAIYLNRLTRLGGTWPGWPVDGLQITSTAVIGNTHALMSDGAGGVIVSWTDARNIATTRVDVYSQRVDPTGAAQWTPGGVAVCTAAGDQFLPHVVPDGSGGVVMTWEDGRVGGDRDVYAQRLSSAGVPQWTANGVAVGSGAGQQSSPELTTGLSGSTVIAWTDSRSGNNDIYAQRLTSTGTAAWTANGVLMISNAQHQDMPRLAPDGSGGAYIVFQDQRNIMASGMDIYAQRVSSTGAILWGATGVPVCTMGLNQQRPLIVALAGGVVIAWEDYRPGVIPVERDIFAQRLLPSGAATWAVDGLDLASVGGDQSELALMWDGKYGVVAAWTDRRADVSGDVYGARVDSGGVLAPGWIADGTPMCTGSANQLSPAIATDGSGGVIVASYHYLAATGVDIRAQRIGRFGRPAVEPVVVTPDGEGGTYVAWEDYSLGDADVRIQRFTESGSVVLGWPMNGFQITFAGGNQQYPRMCPDGEGGVFVVWEDDRNGAANRDVYLQRMSAMGGVYPGWPFDGLDLIDPLNDFDERRPQVVADGAGGAFVAWGQGGLGAAALYYQHVDPSGTPIFVTPIGVNIVQGYDAFSIAPDLAGGLLLSLETFITTSNVGVLHVDGDGLLVWGPFYPSPDGMPQHESSVLSDGAGGAYVAWSGQTGGPPSPSQIMAQHYDAAGAVATGWPAGGLGVCLAAGNQYGLVLTGDETGGALLAWTDERTFGIPDIYAQRVLPAGAVSWTAGGLAVSTAISDQTDPVVIAAGGGGAIVSWVDRRAGTPDVYAQRLTGAGAIGARWTANGVLVAPLPAASVSGDQHAVAIATDGASGAHVAWYDSRGGVSVPDVQMLRIDAFGIAGPHGLAIARVRDVPNDQGGQVQLTWTPHLLDVSPEFEIGEYWIWRQIPESAALVALAAESRVGGETLLEPLTSVASGSARPRRGAIVRMESGYYWEFLEAQPATGFSGYSYVAATTSDFAGGPFPYTAFLIQARHRTLMAFWNSAPDSGYSIDNISPAPPAAFSVQYFEGGSPGLAAGTEAANVSPAAHETAQGTPYAWLHWSPSTEPDFAEYRIHRGATATFEPDAGNLVATRSDTGYVDLGASPSFYKLVAVDVHGNLSVASGAAPSNLLDSPFRRMGILELAPPSPNPTAGELTLRFRLPRTGDATLEVFDLAGRVVRRLAHGVRTAGEHTVRWDGRDQEGGRVGNGMYFVKLRNADEEVGRRITVVR